MILAESLLAIDPRAPASELDRQRGEKAFAVSNILLAMLIEMDRDRVAVDRHTGTLNHG